MFILIGKLLVVTGEHSKWGLNKDNFVRSTEIVDVESSNQICHGMPNFPTGVVGSTGGLLNKNNPMVCGGTALGYSGSIIAVPWSTKYCYTLARKGLSSKLISRYYRVSGKKWIPTLTRLSL